MTYKLNYPVATVVFAGLVVPSLAALLAKLLFEDQLWASTAFHSLLEGLGVLLNISLAIYILLHIRCKLLTPRFIWPASGFLAMAMIGAFHGSLAPSNTFVGLHSIGVLLGGLLFSLIVLPAKIQQQRWIKAVPLLAISLGLLVSITVILSDHLLPISFLQEGKFSPLAIILNSLGGLGFLLITLYLLLNRNADLSHYLLAIMTLMFAVSAVLFEYSTLWDATWWLWHFLRFVSLSLLLAYFFYWFYLQTEITRSQAEKFENLAFRDSLTQLPNRALFYKQLDMELKKAKRQQHTLALLFVDLDRFKQVNDTLGHDIGDKLLILVAERLRQCLREADLLARMGGDEFTVILNGNQTEDSAGKVAQHIIDVLTPRYQVDQHEIDIGASIGIAFYPKDGSEISQLMRLADTAMYQAKAAGRNSYRIYQPD